MCICHHAVRGIRDAGHGCGRMTLVSSCLTTTRTCLQWVSAVCLIAGHRDMHQHTGARPPTHVAITHTTCRKPGALREGDYTAAHAQVVAVGLRIDSSAPEAVRARASVQTFINAMGVQDWKLVPGAALSLLARPWSRLALVSSLSSQQGHCIPCACSILGIALSSQRRQSSARSYCQSM